MLAIDSYDPRNLYGYIENYEELKKVADILDRPLETIHTLEGAKEGFFLWSDLDQLGLRANTFFVVGSYVSISPNPIPVRGVAQEPDGEDRS